jgi:hypothetical protein
MTHRRCCTMSYKIIYRKRNIRSYIVYKVNKCTNDIDVCVFSSQNLSPSYFGLSKSLSFSKGRRRKWLEGYPEATTTDDAVVSDTSIILPWWAWMKRFHLPEAENLNGQSQAPSICHSVQPLVRRQTHFCVQVQTQFSLSIYVYMQVVLPWSASSWFDGCGACWPNGQLFLQNVAVLLVRKNEDLGSLKKVIDESTFYDKQWQATWQDDSPAGPNK